MICSILLPARTGEHGHLQHFKLAAAYPKTCSERVTRLSLRSGTLLGERTTAGQVVVDVVVPSARMRTPRAMCR